MGLPGSRGVVRWHQALPSERGAHTYRELPGHRPSRAFPAQLDLIRVAAPSPAPTRRYRRRSDVPPPPLSGTRSSSGRARLVSLEPSREELARCNAGRVGQDVVAEEDLTPGADSVAPEGELAARGRAGILRRRRGWGRSGRRRGRGRGSDTPRRPGRPGASRNSALRPLPAGDGVPPAARDVGRPRRGRRAPTRRSDDLHPGEPGGGSSRPAGSARW